MHLGKCRLCGRFDVVRPRRVMLDSAARLHGRPFLLCWNCVWVLNLFGYTAVCSNKKGSYAP